MNYLMEWRKVRLRPGTRTPPGGRVRRPDYLFNTRLLSPRSNQAPLILIHKESLHSLGLLCLWFVCLAITTLARDEVQLESHLVRLLRS
jgi:hypothetical protein